MARKIAPDTESKDVRAMELVAQDEKEHAITAVKVFEAFGVEGKDYDFISYTQMARTVFQMHAATGIVGGRILLVIKESEKHGTFMKAVEQIGLEYRTAARYMNAAKRFGKYDNLSHLPNSKLSALEFFSEPELEPVQNLFISTAIKARTSI